jgi:hypothetical protein
MFVAAVHRSSLVLICRVVGGFDVRLVERVHGHLGLLSVAVLAHPAIVLRRAHRRAHLAVTLAVIFPALTAALGVWLYGPYRSELKQRVFIESRTMGNLFERKEHLAFGVVALAVAGACAYLASREKKGDPRLSRAAHLAFVLSFAMALATAILGTVVAANKSF